MELIEGLSESAGMLQRSPDLAVGEWGPGSTRSSRAAGFNGAPTSRSGNVGVAAVVVVLIIKLQRSPDLAVGE